MKKQTTVNNKKTSSTTHTTMSMKTHMHAVNTDKKKNDRR